MTPPRMQPKDGIAWVTGASSGIGAAVALELARRGWTVAATARRLDKLEALGKRMAAAGGFEHLMLVVLIVLMVFKPGA